ncbi:hypothetical protein RF11_13632 [Thelohanellus kitauei]|uniref:Uncharacterized protein n=1 Tax=Thelohanellus kitauei TaxID=669202 RepID=A0A0C2NBU9_THEKT|nr:hypothetical protein RF11_13632 [Thelohanellus kitauei]
MNNIYQCPSSNATNQAFTQVQLNNIQQYISSKDTNQVVNPESHENFHLYRSQKAKYPVFLPDQQSNILHPWKNFICQDNIDQYTSTNDNIMLIIQNHVYSSIITPRQVIHVNSWIQNNRIQSINSIH